MFFKRLQPVVHNLASTPNPPALPYQTQCPLLDRLPAEIRNEIYTHVFTTEPASMVPSASRSSTPHPLSLLLACRRIYHEAGILAFSTYLFPLRSGLQATYLSLRAEVSHLSAVQVGAIRSLSVQSSSGTGSLLSNALFIFPHLSQFVAKTERKRIERHGLSKREWYRSHPSARSAVDSSGDADLRLQAVDRYAPHCLTDLLHIVTSGEAYAWQIGSKWSSQWPQLDSAYCYSKIQCDKEGLREELYMDDDAVGLVSGVEMCICGCDEVSWTCAVLVQEGGRKVEVKVVYCGKVDGERSEAEQREEMKDGPRIILVPGTTPASEVVVEGDGYRYEADDEYWEAIRRRNGNLGALYRELWKTTAAWPAATMAYKNESYSKLTTWKKGKKG